jgi:hypothetical protein
MKVEIGIGFYGPEITIGNTCGFYHSIPDVKEFFRDHGRIIHKDGPALQVFSVEKGLSLTVA